MKLHYPHTPNLRYERMCLAAMAATACGLMGAVLGSWALGTTELNGWMQTGEVSGPALRAATLAVLSCSLIVLALAFLCFTLIKLDAQAPARRWGWLRGVQRIGHRLLWSSMGLGMATVVLQAAAHVVG